MGYRAAFSRVGSERGVVFVWVPKRGRMVSSYAHGSYSCSSGPRVRVVFQVLSYSFYFRYNGRGSGRGYYASGRTMMDG